MLIADNTKTGQMTVPEPVLYRYCMGSCLVLISYIGPGCYSPSVIITQNA